MAKNNKKSLKKILGLAEEIKKIYGVQGTNIESQDYSKNGKISVNYFGTDEQKNLERIVIQANGSRQTIWVKLGTKTKEWQYKNPSENEKRNYQQNIKNFLENNYSEILVT